MSLQADTVLSALVAGIEAVTLVSTAAPYTAATSFRRVADYRNALTQPPPRGFTLSVSRGLRNTETSSVGAPELEIAVQAIFAYPDTGDGFATYARILGDQNALLADLLYLPGGSGRAAISAALGADAPKLSKIEATGQAVTTVFLEGQQGFYEATVDFNILFQSV